MTHQARPRSAPGTAIACASSGVPRGTEDVRSFDPAAGLGTGRYTPEGWGFSARELRARLGRYIEHSDVALE